MAEPWPATLPQALRIDGLSRTFADGRLRAETAAGPGKVRLRSSAAVKRLAGTMILTAAQKDTLETFVETALNGGAGVIDFPDPEGAGTILVRFVEELPSIAAVTPDLWQVQFDFEIMP